MLNKSPGSPLWPISCESFICLYGIKLHIFRPNGIEPEQGKMANLVNSNLPSYLQEIGTNNLINFTTKTYKHFVEAEEEHVGEELMDL